MRVSTKPMRAFGLLTLGWPSGGQHGFGPRSSNTPREVLKVSAAGRVKLRASIYGAPSPQTDARHPRHTKRAPPRQAGRLPQVGGAPGGDLNAPARAPRSALRAYVHASRSARKCVCPCMRRTSWSQILPGSAEKPRMTRRADTPSNFWVLN